MLSNRFLEIAIDAARQAGADYAEARAEDALSDRIHVRNGAVERLSTDRDSGWGVHVLAGGGWGFASSSSDKEADAQETARKAVEVARASGSRRHSQSDLSMMPTEQGEYSTSLRQDPFAIPFAERVDLLVESSNRISATSERVVVSTGTMQFSRTEKLFVNTVGANLRQSITYAGYFDGNLHVTGSCCAAAAGTFKIDHPLDPANKYLSHAAVESPDMLDIYSGNITTDVAGNATVMLPGYFEALNRDFRYQLTVVGQFAQAIVLSEVKHNSFDIKTDKPNVKVSWQVTGIRHDPYAEQHPITVEQDKPASEKGKYLYPKENGQPETLGIGYEMQQTLKHP